MTFQFSSRTANLLVLCLFCFALTLLSGCGSGVPKLTPAEQTEVDKYLEEHGREAIVHYLWSSGESDEALTLKYVQYFLSQGADIGAEWNRMTPLSLAIQKDQLSIVNFIVSKTGGIKSKHDDGYTPLHIATKEGKNASVELFISKGADVNAKADGGVTPLHMAVMRSQGKIVELLVSKGADVNAKTSYGLTALHYEAGSGDASVEIVKFLVSKGADANAKDSSGYTPLDNAKSAKVQQDQGMYDYRGQYRAIIDYLSGIK